jgi:DNA-binding NarL/FixJ family response regulator
MRSPHGQQGGLSMKAQNPTPAQKTKILLVNHKTLISAGLRCLLEKIPDLEVVGETTLGLKTPNVVASRNPDMLLIYLSMSAYEEVALAERILQRMPSLPVIVLTINTSAEYLLHMLHSGIRGVLCQRSTASELELAVLTVKQGQIFLTPSLPKDVENACRAFLKQGKFPLEALTARQNTILKLIAEGRNTKEIADRLKLSAKTVEFHRARLMERLGIRDVPGLVRYAIRAGVIQV